MVWGMASPHSLGDFFPDGTFIGWKEELTDYFETKMSAKRKAAFGNDVHSYIYYVAQKFICEPGTANDPDMPPFSAIEPHEAPRRLLTVKKYSSLGSMITLYGKLWAADRQLKSIIETLEPGMHFFSSLEIVMPKGAVYPKQYFILSIRHYLDSFAPEQSAPDSWSPAGMPEYIFFEDSKKQMAQLALSRKTFGEAHLWRERRMVNDLICFSDRFKSEIDRAGLRLPKHHPLKGV